MELIALKSAPFAKELISKRLEESGIHINRYAEILFSHGGFSTEGGYAGTIAIASLSEIGLEDGAALPEIFARIAELGFKPCGASAGLFLRLAWAEQAQSKNSVLSGTHSAPDGAVTVLSEILENDNSFPKGLYLRNVEGRLWLRGYVCDDEYRFSGDDVFAFENNKHKDKEIKI